MLSPPEKVIFLIATLSSLYFGWEGAKGIIRIISRGVGKPNWTIIPNRLFNTLLKTITLSPTWKIRFTTSLFHAFVAWGFLFYVLVNIGDILQAFTPGYKFLGTGTVGNLYRLGADLLSVGVLFGMTYLLVRRFLFKPGVLSITDNVLIHPKARRGIIRDSAIVGIFILLHVGFRFIGESFVIALDGQPDKWQPLASLVSTIWLDLNPGFIMVMIHISFWIAIGLILAFIPYFPYSKHIHLIIAPINILLKPERRSIGELEPLDFDNDEIEQFGASTLEDLGWEQLLDAYACIMCNRCQDVCPAYLTGKVLSPAALEINKRYFLNYESDKPGDNKTAETKLLDFAISEEAVWACTACGACIDICPVGNEPMMDILDIRRSLVLMENNFPETWQTAFRGMERSMNPWNIPPTERMKWAEGLDVPTIEINHNPEYLWWVGCAASTDDRAQKTARSFAKILNHAGIDFAVLGKNETCTGDSARRAGNEYLFYELAQENIKIFNEVRPKKIITTCPHCLHTIKNEYPAFGGSYEVIHHTVLINDLLASGKLHLDGDGAGELITFHDPCYLGRQNDIVQEPRLSIQQSGAGLIEMENFGKQSFCCGAGGSQIWKEEEKGNTQVNLTRFDEAIKTGADTLAVACPFCMIMLKDASKETAHDIDIADIAEIVEAKINEKK